MTYTILNKANGSASEIFFENENQLANWLKTNPNFVSCGAVNYTLPTRHVRMNNNIK